MESTKTIRISNPLVATTSEQGGGISSQRAAQVQEVIDEASGRIYLPPCQIACPVGTNIQRSHAMIALLSPDALEASNRIIEVGDEIYEKNPLFPLCSYICGLCEQECNYKDQTGAVRRRLLGRFISDYYLPYLATKPPLAPPTGEKVALIGGGPASLMAGYTLSKKGYQVTILERESRLGGALRYIPGYRIPKNLLDFTLNNLVRIAHIEVKFGVRIGGGGKSLDDLKNEGYRAIFIATGTPLPRPLTIAGEPVAGADLSQVMFGLDLLLDVSQGKAPPHLFQGKKVIVVGGGNVAFDVARTARRLGGDVSVLCLECEDRASKDGIPADVEELRGAREEGIGISYCRGVGEVSREGGKLKIKCPRCTSVFDGGGFNPTFDQKDRIYFESDVLLVTIGQAWERTFFQREGLLNKKGKLDVDQLTLMSNRKGGVFIGGDVRRVGFAAEAMRDGMIAAESIDRYLKGEDLMLGRERKYERAAIPKRTNYKPQPELAWAPVEERLHFEPFENRFTLEEAVEEARRCLYCGPCKSCKGCVARGLQSEIPEIEVNRELCSGCGICVAVCGYDAPRLEKSDGGTLSVIDDIKCKRCGTCIAACPAGAITIKDELLKTVDNIYATL